MNIINTIKTYRKKRNLTQFQVAEILKMDRTSYNNLETGKTNLRADDFVKLIDVLNIPLSELSKDELIVISKQDLDLLNKSVSDLANLTNKINEQAKIDNKPNIFDNHGIINFNNK
mgnify:CR=1 FL=1